VAQLERWAKNMTLYKSAWWSLKVPAGWCGREEDACHTFESEDGVGALQVSAHRKGGAPVTDDDLREFAGEVPLRAVALDAVTGFRARFSDDDTFWIMWWLRAGSTLIHVTYNCALEDRNEEEETLIERSVSSLSIR
jgi:hypothetical protein